MPPPPIIIGFLAHHSHQIENTTLFSFMAPLITDKSCLQCHQKQGYQVGDIRGGVSVTYPIHTKKTNALIISHLIILSAGVLLIAGFGERIVRLTERLKKQSHIVWTHRNNQSETF